MAGATALNERMTMQNMKSNACKLAEFNQSMHPSLNAPLGYSNMQCLKRHIDQTRAGHPRLMKQLDIKR